MYLIPCLPFNVMIEQHHIGTLSFQLDYPDGLISLEQTRHVLYGMNGQRCIQPLEEIFTRIVPEKECWLIDRLEFEIRVADESRLEETVRNQLPRLMEEKLRSLSAHMDFADTFKSYRAAASSPFDFSNDDSDKLSIQSYPKADFYREAWFYFLEHGILPDPLNPLSFSERTWEEVLDASVWIRHLHRLIRLAEGQNGLAVCLRLTTTVSFGQLYELGRLWLRHHTQPGMWKQYAEQVLDIQSSNWSEPQWSFFFRSLASPDLQRVFSTESPNALLFAHPEEQSPVQSPERQNRIGVEPNELEEIRLPETEPTESMIRANETSQPSVPLSPALTTEEMLTNLADGRDDSVALFGRPKERTGFITGTAGLVLLHPYIPRFLETIGCWSPKGWTGNRAREKAVQALHYLATGIEGRPEWELALEKFLCGLDMHEALGRETILAEEDRNEAEQLLQIFLQHWKKPGLISNEALRGSFLRRQGRLTRTQEALHIKVDVNSIDILLHHLPFGLSFFRLPWLDRMVETEWDYQIL